MPSGSSPTLIFLTTVFLSVRMTDTESSAGLTVHTSLLSSDMAMGLDQLGTAGGALGLGGGFFFEAPAATPATVTLNPTASAAMAARRTGLGSRVGSIPGLPSAWAQGPGLP